MNPLDLAFGFPQALVELDFVLDEPLLYELAELLNLPVGRLEVHRITVLVPGCENSTDRLVQCITPKPGCNDNAAAPRNPQGLKDDPGQLRQVLDHRERGEVVDLLLRRHVGSAQLLQGEILEVSHRYSSFLVN